MAPASPFFGCFDANVVREMYDPRVTVFNTVDSRQSVSNEVSVLLGGVVCACTVRMLAKKSMTMMGIFLMAAHISVRAARGRSGSGGKRTRTRAKRGEEDRLSQNCVRDTRPAAARDDGDLART